MRNTISITTILIFLLTAHVVRADDERKFRLDVQRVGDDFTMLKYDVSSGEIWYHNEEDQWQRLVSEEGPLERSTYQVVVAPFLRMRSVTNPAAGLVTYSVPTSTVFRIDQTNGNSWVRSEGRMEPFSSNSESGISEGPFELVCEQIGDGFALYRYSKSSGKVWTYSNRDWALLDSSKDLPAGHYSITLAIHADEDNSTLFRIFRIEQSSGATWEYKDGRFVEVKQDE